MYMSECTYTPDTVEDFNLLGIQQEHDGNETLEARSVQILWVHTQHTVVSLEGRRKRKSKLTSAKSFPFSLNPNPTQ